MEMFKLAGDKGLDEPRFLADHAYAINQCVVSGKANQIDLLVSKADSLYEQAIQTPNPNHRAYAYQMWARSALLNEDVKLARDRVKEAQQLGANIDQSLLLELNDATN